MAEVPISERQERQLVANARSAFTRLVGMELGDKLADEVWEARKARREAQHD